MWVSLNRYIPFPCTSCLRNSNMVTCKNKRNSPISFIFANIRWQLITKIRPSAREFQIPLSSWQKFAFHGSEISLCRNSPERKFALAKFRQNKNSLPPLLLFFWIAFMWVKWFKRCCFPSLVVFERWNGYTSQVLQGNWLHKVNHGWMCSSLKRLTVCQGDKTAKAIK